MGGSTPRSRWAVNLESVDFFFFFFKDTVKGSREAGMDLGDVEEEREANVIKIHGIKFSNNKKYF